MKRGRPLLGERPLTPSERQRRCRAKKKDQQHDYPVGGEWRSSGASVSYKLKITRNFVGYDGRLKTSRALGSAVHRHGLAHDNVDAAFKAAKVLSKNPLVDRVTLVKVVESEPIIFRNGETMQ
jgi:hypothetical protein